MVSLGVRLRKERKRVGLTQSRLSILGEVSQNTQWLFEMDRRPPKSDYLAAIPGAATECGQARVPVSFRPEQMPKNKQTLGFNFSTAGGSNGFYSPIFFRYQPE